MCTLHHRLSAAEGGSPAMLRAMWAVLPSGTMVLPVVGSTHPTWVRDEPARAAGLGTGSVIYNPGDTAEIVRRKARAPVF